MTTIEPATIEILGPNDAARLENLLSGLSLAKDSGYFERVLREAGASRILFVAAVNRVDCGLCVLNFAPIYPAFKRLNIPEIQDLNVTPAFRRQGVGAAIIAACENRVRSMGHDMVGMGVGLTSSYGAAQRLYARLGYVPDGAGVYYDGQPVIHGELRSIDDDLCLYMVKEL
jgi:GNAT superfamily N-acetyltransferase